MPLISTLGALAEFRQIGTSEWIILFTTPSNPGLLQVGVKNFELDNPNNFYVAATSNVLGTPKYQTFINCSTYGLQSPNLVNVSTFIANANAESTPYGITKNNNIVYTVGTQEYNNGNSIVSGIVIRSFDSNNAVLDNFITTSNYGPPNNIIINDANEVVITSNIAASNGNSYMLFYNGNTMSNAYIFSNVVGNRAGLYEYNNGNYIIGSLAAGTANNVSIFDINDDLVTINYNKTFTSNVSINSIEFIHKENNSYYVQTFGDAYRGILAKITNNTVDWAKTNGANGQIGLYQSSYHNNKIYTTTFDGINAVPKTKIICFDANTGNVSWVNELSLSGSSNFANSYIGSQRIKVTDDGIYLFTNIETISAVPGMAVLKLPLSGTIPGTGNYNVSPSSGGNIFVNYVSSNITLSNANVTVSNGNMSISAANVANTIDANVSANITYSFIVTSKKIR